MALNIFIFLLILFPLFTKCGDNSQLQIFIQYFKAFLQIIITFIFKMNPFFSPSYFYNPIYNYSLYQAMPTNGNQFYHYFPSNPYPIAQSNIYQQKDANQNLLTKPDVVKIEVIDSEGQPVNHQTTKQTKSKKLKKDNKCISNLITVKVEEKLEKKSNIKVKYFDPTVAPLVTSQGYNQILRPEKQQKFIDQRSENLESNFDELAFPQKDEKPFIVFRYRRIKKRYKKYLQKYNNLTAAQDYISQNSQSSEVQSQKNSNSDSNQFMQKMENPAMEINTQNKQANSNSQKANSQAIAKINQN